jgi:hypothetical protein
MKKPLIAGRDVIANEYMPVRLPVIPTVALWLLLDRLAVPGWAWGVFWTVFAFLWFSSTLGLWFQREKHPSEIAK